MDYHKPLSIFYFSNAVTTKIIPHDMLRVKIFRYHPANVGTTAGKCNYLVLLMRQPRQVDNIYHIHNWVVVNVIGIRVDKTVGVSNHRCLGCLLHRLFRCRLKKNHQSLALLIFVKGIHWWPMNSPHKRANNSENHSIWWRHQGNRYYGGLCCMISEEKERSMGSMYWQLGWRQHI